MLLRLETCPYESSNAMSLLYREIEGEISDARRSVKSSGVEIRVKNVRVYKVLVMSWLICGYNIVILLDYNN